MGPVAADSRLGPRYCPTRWLTTMVTSRLNHAAFDPDVYASQRRSPATTHDSLPAAGSALPGGIGYPQGFNERFHV